MATEGKLNASNETRVVFMYMQMIRFLRFKQSGMVM